MNCKLGFILLMSIFYACHSKTEPKENNKKTGGKNLAVEAIVVKPTLLVQTISVSGTLKPFEETVLMPEVAGRVVSINLPEGKAVKQGTLLVKLFDGDLKAQLQKLEAQLHLVEQTQKRQSELLKISGISQTDYDQTVLQISTIKADIEVSKVQISKTELKAPYDGVIGLRNVSLGSQVTTATALTTIRAVKQLKLDFSVPEKYSREIKAGMKVDFKVQSDDRKYQAKVLATEEGIETSSRNLKVRAVVDGNTNLVAGTFANVELRMGENQNALLVPTQSLIPQERDKKIIISKNGKATFVKVKSGVRQESNIEIIEGIQAGDTIVTTGLLFVKQGDVLKFSKIK